MISKLVRSETVLGALTRVVDPALDGLSAERDVLNHDFTSLELELGKVSEMLMLVKRPNLNTDPKFLREKSRLCQEAIAELTAASNFILEWIGQLEALHQSGTEVRALLLHYQGEDSLNVSSEYLQNMSRWALVAHNLIHSCRSAMGKLDLAGAILRASAARQYRRQY